MVKLSKPNDGKQASLRDKFPILSSLSEHTVNHGARKISHPLAPRSSPKPLNRSKSLFSLVQSFFKKVDDSDGFATQPTTHTSSLGTSNSAKVLQYQDPLYYADGGAHLFDQENTRRSSSVIPKAQHNTWNPLASIRGRLDKSFFSVRGRGGSQPQPQHEFDADVDSPMKRRKSLHGLHDAWGTVGKKFTLRGRKRGQAEAALSAYTREPTDSIELPDLGPTIYIDNDCKSLESLPSQGLSTGTRQSSSSSRSTALLDRESPEELEPITIPKSTNGRKRCGEERTSDISSCLPKTLQPARTRSTSKRVAFASATQLQMMEEAKQRPRVTSGSINASGCPGLTSAEVSVIGLSLATPATGAESPVSPPRLAEYAERTMVDEQAEMDLIERMLDNGASFTSVDLDVFHENRRQLRQARYNMLMDPAKQVENFQVFTEVIENTARMLNNVGHADVEVISRGSSFSGPVYTWTDGEIVMRNDAQVADVSAKPEVHRKKGEAVIHYRPAGIPDVDLENHYNKSVVTVTELVETDESDAEATPEKSTANDMGLAFFAEKRRGRSLSRTPTKNLAVNNREKSKSPLKRLHIRLTPSKQFERHMEDATSSSTMAVRCPTPSTASEEESTYTLTPPSATTLERLLDLPKRLIGHMWTDTSSDEGFLSNIDLKWLSRKENRTNTAVTGPHFYSSAEAKLNHHQWRDAAKSKREGKAPAIPATAHLDRYTELCDREKKRAAVRAADRVRISSGLKAFQAEEAAKFRRGTVTSSDSNVHSTIDGEAYFTAGETSPGQVSIFSGVMTPELTPGVVAAEPPSSPGKAKDFEELRNEFLAFQAAEEAEFRRSFLQREQNKRDECCQYWRSCEKVGKCYEIRTKEYLAEKAGQDQDMEWKKKHWVEGYFCAKRGSTASKEKQDRATSFTFVAGKKRIRMATYGGSSFFVKKSSTPITASGRRAFGQKMPQTPILKGKEKSSFADEESFVLDDSLIDGMDYYEDCLDGDDHITFDDDFHPQPNFTINPSGYSTDIPGGGASSASSTSSVSLRATSRKTFNNYGNIRCWSPPDLPPKRQLGYSSQVEHIEDVAIRGVRGKETLFENVQWPPSTQGIFRANYPTNPPGPRSPVQRNGDSGYWDDEKNSQVSQAQGSQEGPGGSLPPPDAPPAPEPAPRPPSAPNKTAAVSRSPPHSTAAHIRARYEKNGQCKVEQKQFIDEQHSFLVNSFGNIGTRYTTAQQILATLEDPHLAKQGAVNEKHAELIKSLTEIGRRNSEELQKVNAGLAKMAHDAASVNTAKGKGKAPALPPRSSNNNNTWKGKSQEWPKQPTFISLEPATTTYQSTFNAAGLPKGRKVTPNLCVQTRNITPQATINGKGPVSPLTKAWLESKAVKKPKDFTEERVEQYISAVEKPYPVPGYSYYNPNPPAGEPSSGAGKIPLSKKGRHFYANVTGDGKAVAIPPIRMLRPSLEASMRTVSGVSVAATMVDEEFGEDLVDFRVESRESRGEVDESMSEERIKEEMDELEKRVPSWMMYG